MSTNTIEQLAELPAGQDQIERAKAYCVGEAALESEVAAFIKNEPTRGQMILFLEGLKLKTDHLRRRQAALVVCRNLGIENPTNTELLFADRSVALQTALELNQRNTMAALKKLGIQIDEAPGVMTGALVGGLVASIF